MKGRASKRSQKIFQDTELMIITIYFLQNQIPEGVRSTVSPSSLLQRLGPCHRTQCHNFKGVSAWNLTTNKLKLILEPSSFLDGHRDSLSARFRFRYRFTVKLLFSKRLAFCSMIWRHKKMKTPYSTLKKYHQMHRTSKWNTFSSPHLVNILTSCSLEKYKNKKNQKFDLKLSIPLSFH